MIKRFNNFKDTLVVSGFPGVGKTHLFNNKEIDILDSDSSKFDKSDFPSNYIRHIKENLGKVDVILVSSHKDVRDALHNESIDFTLVYPSRELKNEFIERYKNRGSNEKFIELVSNNWDSWINELESQEGCKHIQLKSGEYLSDVIK